MGLGLEIFKNNPLETVWNDFWAWAWKSLKIGSWKASGTIFGSGPGNVQTLRSGSVLERFLGQGLEILKNKFLETFWNDFWAWAWKCLKIAPWKPSGATFGPGPENP